MDQLPTSAQCQDVGFILWAGGFISSTACLFCLLMNTKTSDLLNPDSRGFISGKTALRPQIFTDLRTTQKISHRGKRQRYRCLG